LKILACVFNEIDFDGRVQRAAEALAEIAEVVVFSLDSGNQFRSDKFRSVVVKRAKLPGAAVLTHLKAWVSLWLRVIRERPDVVHAHDCFMAFPGWVAARICGARLVYDAHELVIPEGRDSELKFGIREWIWYWLEKWTIPRADVVIAANEERAEIMRRHYGLRAMPLVIKNIPPRPASLAEPAEIPDALRKSTPQDKLIVYQGDVDVRRGIDRFVEAFKHLPANYRLVIVGGGPSVGMLGEYAQQNGLDGRVQFVRRLPRLSLPGLLQRCDVGIVTYSHVGLNSQLCASNKVYECAHVNLPLVMTAQMPLKRINEEYRIGRTVERSESAAEIAEAIRAVAENRDEHSRNTEAFATANVWETEAAKLRAGVAALGGRS
jgi:glycosyltransferase involved in cell wall biosynthesis